jgi:hypothetical protein
VGDAIRKIVTLVVASLRLRAHSGVGAISTEYAKSGKDPR